MIHPWRTALAAAAMASLVAASPSLAHHSAAMFDKTKTVTLSGTVSQFQWTNPHSWIQVVVEDGGAPVEWSVEMGAPVELFRIGWRPATLKPGDKIVLIVNPMRDGGHGALFVSGKRQDGAPIGKAG
ncbi:MAG: DUF6152 family protein [Caulobacteraceae bacterium]